MGAGGLGAACAAAAGFGAAGIEHQATASAAEAQMVSESVLTLSHSLSTKPCASKKARMRVEFHPTISSRIGIRTLNASSLRIVRCAICVMYLFSDTAMVN